MYNKTMNFKKNISGLFHYKHIDPLMVSSLYKLSMRSLVAVIAFSCILTYTLYPELGDGIVYWEGGLLLLMAVRYSATFLYRKKAESFSLLTWYKIFVVLAFLTATFFALLGSVALVYLDNILQIFVVATLVGLTAGAMSSLFPDIRIVIVYISIILILMIISLSSRKSEKIIGIRIIEI